jgi:hypothetical protein
VAGPAALVFSGAEARSEQNRRGFRVHRRQPVRESTQGGCDDLAADMEIDAAGIAAGAHQSVLA